MSNIKVSRISDRDIAAKLSQLQSDILKGRMPPVSFTALAQHLGPIRFPEQNDEAWGLLLAADGYSIEHFGFSVEGQIKVSYYRGGRQEQKSPYFDDLSVEALSGDGKVIEAAARIASLFQPIAVIPPGAAVEEGVLALRAQQEASFARLERLHAEGVTKAAETLEEQETRFQARLSNLEGSFADKKRALEDELQEERNRLAESAKALEAQRKELDDRNNTHARRAIRQGMLEDIKQRIGKFGVSEATEAKRRPVQFGMAMLLIFLFLAWVVTVIETMGADRVSSARHVVDIAAVAASAASGTASAANSPATRGSGETSAVMPPVDPSAYWLRWGRLLLLSLGIAATLLYYVRWQHQWAERHAQSEFALQQFQLDVNRANWVLESCLEWRKETASPIPTTLLESMTRGLFAAADAKEEPALHPADELAKAILGSSSKVRLHAGDSEIEIDRPGKTLNK